MAPLQKDKARDILKTYCQYKARDIHYKAPYIGNTVDGILLGIEFHMENLDEIRDRFNIFLFPDLSLSVGPQVALAERRWDTVLESSMLEPYSETISLLQIHILEPTII